MILLVVDDDPEDIELFVDAVKRIDENFTCVIAVDGSEALQKLASITPDFIFLDINMPVMDGKEALIHIRHDRRFRSVPIFILSTSNDSKEAEVCRKLGATRWLVKPSSFDELVEKLKAVVKNEGGSCL